MRLLRAYYDSNGQLDLDALPIGNLLRRRLRDEFVGAQTNIQARHTSSDGTVKLLVGMSGGGAVESVLIPSFRPDRAAGCISSQIGCAMACDFCASGREGLTRNLTDAQIVEQFLHLRAHAASLGRKLTSLVFMGMGEPLHNLANVRAAIDRIADPILGNLGWRRITVSTVGIVLAMDELASAQSPVNLALSLHAPDDQTRSQIVPANRRWNVAAVMDAARRYQNRTGRIVNVEYCLLAGVNDSDDQARLLAGLMSGFPAHVNLIPHNWIGQGPSGTAYQRPSSERIAQFAKILADHNVVIHIRVQRGDDVSAACGQLHRRGLELTTSAN